MDKSNLSATARRFVTVDLDYFALALKHTRSLHDRLHIHHAPNPHSEPPTVITTQSYEDTLPSPHFWNAIRAISIISRLMTRLHPEDNCEYEQSYCSLCSVVRNNWATLWKWVLCGVRRAWHLDRFPLPSHNTSFLLDTLHKFMSDLLDTDTKHGLHKSLFADGAEAFLDLWYLHTIRPELDHLVQFPPDYVVNEWLMDGNGSWLRLLGYGDTPERLVKLVLHRSRKLFRTKQGFLIKKVDHILHHISFLMCITSIPAIRKHLDAADATTFYTRTFIRVSAGIGLKDKKESISRGQVAEELGILLIICFERMQGITRRLRRSLETGLLVGIVQCAPRTPEDAAVRSVPVLVNTLTKYLDHNSILRLVMRFLSKPQVAQAFSLMLKCGPFWTTLMNMISMSQLRVKLLGSSMIRTFNSTQCRLKNVGRYSRREKAVYCSIDCQSYGTGSGYLSYYQDRSRNIHDSENSFLKNEYTVLLSEELEGLKYDGFDAVSPVPFESKKYKTFRHPKFQSDHTFLPVKTTLTENDNGENYFKFDCRITYGYKSRLAGDTSEAIERWPWTHVADLTNPIKKLGVEYMYHQNDHI
ncbi:hypothetical protein E4T56_gene11618 [Termitomyces sp. T112]|nr:hypothetical protein E4T56_gene11618 [Termitomyces sp. T112]